MHARDEESAAEAEAAVLEAYEIGDEPPRRRTIVLDVIVVVPELPEVETERGRLARRIEGRRIAAARIDDPRLTRPEPPEWVAAGLTGERVTDVERRGKYLLIRLESGDVLVVHLRMTGSFRYEPASHERAVLELDDGTRIAYRDLRRFGTWALLDPEEAEDHLAVRLGPEPLGRAFTSAYLAGRLAGRRAPVKAAILDQRTVAGLGNIYADEALWHAGIHPLRPAGELADEEIAALRDGIRAACAAESGARAPTSATAPTPAAECSTNFASTAASANRATAAECRSKRRARAAAARGSAPRARYDVERMALPAWPKSRLAWWAVRTRRRRSSSARSGTRRPTGSSTSTPPTAAGSARSPRACGGRPRASAAGSSRSATSS